MSPGTVGLPAVRVADCGELAPCVLGRCHWLEVRRVHAGRDATKVVDMESRRDRFHEQLVGDTLGLDWQAVDVHFTVPERPATPSIRAPRRIDPVLLGEAFPNRSALHYPQPPTIDRDGNLPVERDQRLSTPDDARHRGVVPGHKAGSHSGERSNGHRGTRTSRRHEPHVTPRHLLHPPDELARIVGTKTGLDRAELGEGRVTSGETCGAAAVPLIAEDRIVVVGVLPHGKEPDGSLAA